MEGLLSAGGPRVYVPRRGCSALRHEGGMPWKGCSALRHEGGRRHEGLFGARHEGALAARVQMAEAVMLKKLKFESFANEWLNKWQAKQLAKKAAEEAAAEDDDDEDLPDVQSESAPAMQKEKKKKKKSSKKKSFLNKLLTTPKKRKSKKGSAIKADEADTAETENRADDGDYTEAPDASEEGVDDEQEGGKHKARNSRKSRKEEIPGLGQALEEEILKLSSEEGSFALDLAVAPGASRQPPPFKLNFLLPMLDLNRRHSSNLDDDAGDRARQSLLTLDSLDRERPLPRPGSAGGAAVSATLSSTLAAVQAAQKFKDKARVSEWKPLGLDDWSAKASGGGGWKAPAVRPGSAGNAERPVAMMDWKLPKRPEFKKLPEPWQDKRIIPVSTMQPKQPRLPTPAPEPVPEPEPRGPLYIKPREWPKVRHTRRTLLLMQANQASGKQAAAAPFGDREPLPVANKCLIVQESGSSLASITSSLDATTASATELKSMFGTLEKQLEEKMRLLEWERYLNYERQRIDMKVNMLLEHRKEDRAQPIVDPTVPKAQAVAPTVGPGAWGPLGKTKPRPQGEPAFGTRVDVASRSLISEHIMKALDSNQELAEADSEQAQHILDDLMHHCFPRDPNLSATVQGVAIKGAEISSSDECSSSSSEEELSVPPLLGHHPQTPQNYRPKRRKITMPKRCGINAPKHRRINDQRPQTTQDRRPQTAQDQIKAGVAGTNLADYNFFAPNSPAESCKSAFRNPPGAAAAPSFANTVTTKFSPRSMAVAMSTDCPSPSSAPHRSRMHSPGRQASPASRRRPYSQQYIHLDGPLIAPQQALKAPGDLDGLPTPHCAPLSPIGSARGRPAPPSPSAGSRVSARSWARAAHRRAGDLTDELEALSALPLSARALPDLNPIPTLTLTIRTPKCTPRIKAQEPIEEPNPDASTLSDRKGGSVGRNPRDGTRPSPGRAAGGKQGTGTRKKPERGGHDRIWESLTHKDKEAVGPWNGGASSLRSESAPQQKREDASKPSPGGRRDPIIRLQRASHEPAKGSSPGHAVQGATQRGVRLAPEKDPAVWRKRYPGSVAVAEPAPRASHMAAQGAEGGGEANASDIFLPAEENPCAGGDDVVPTRRLHDPAAFPTGAPAFCLFGTLWSGQ
ncbi:hypothetical protein CYMTET_21011 [Cymbomonas tetramitiformis]|uniref:Uncharacterized protein n=1 Tax=Cymbomonas tetramitiformis TaxID=36881 RepID=A0AAE0G2Y0_9CHLO|nr:hypothetical protein CYMTET_21011 [Cymbomonas tetramitiformis]